MLIDWTQRASLPAFSFVSHVPGFIGLPGIAEHKPADRREDHDKGHAHIKVRARVAEGQFDLFLDMGAVEDACLGGYAEYKAELYVNLAVLETLDRAHKGLGELVAHVARHCYETGNAQAHHARREHEGPA